MRRTRNKVKNSAAKSLEASGYHHWEAYSLIMPAPLCARSEQILSRDTRSKRNVHLVTRLPTPAVWFRSAFRLRNLLLMGSRQFKTW